jgi:exonuclease SbcD
VRISQVNRAFPEADARTLEEAYSYVIDSFGVDRSRRNILVSHQFIRGAVKGGSEEMTIGGLEEIDSRILDPFDYAALGHIHAPQRAGRDGIRYSGSILKYHFDETDQEKGALIVDILEKGNVKIEKVPLRPMRDMRRIRGRFRDLQDLPGSDDYIEAILEDEELIMDARGSLSTVFPNIISVKRAERSAGRDIEEVSDPEKDSIEDHFRTFYMMQHDGKEPDDRQMALIRDTLRKMEEEDETVIS